MSFGSHFPFSWDEEMEFLDKCQQSVNIQSIAPENAVPAFDFKELLTEKKSDKKPRGDRIIIGINPPSIHSFTFTKHKTTTITQIQIQTNATITSTQQPPQKKQKTSDWRTGHNKPYVSTHKNKKNTNNKIPIGCERLFDSETGALVSDLQDLDPKLVESIGYELLNKMDNISWNDIAGLELEKQKIKEIVIWPLQRSDLFDSDSLLAPPKGVLLFGPPGTGKTMIAKAIANESNANFFSISPSSLQSKWIGESAKLVKTMFSIARYMAPSIIFIDECDSLLSKRGSDGSSSNNSMNTLKTQFLMEFQGAKTNKNDGYVLIVGATNFPEVIDDAARRRLSKRLYIPLPDATGRKQLLLNLLQKADKTSGHILIDKDIDILVNKTKGYSGSDISDVVLESALGPLRDSKYSVQTVEKKSLRPLQLTDVEQAIKHTTASNTAQDIDRYEQWNDKFGSKLR